MKILFYAFADTGMGHVTRVSRLATDFAISLNIKTAIASDQDIPNNICKKITTYNIPHPSWENETQYLERILNAKDIAYKFKPDVILIDYYPFCEKNVDREIHILIKTARIYTKHLFVGSIFRGFLSGTSNISIATKRATDNINCIDHLFIMVPEYLRKQVQKNNYALQKYYDKCTFLGFLNIEKSEMSSECFNKNKWDIVIQFGGCCDQLYSEVQYILNTLNYLNKSVRILFSTGKNTSHKLHTQIKESLQENPNIIITKWKENIFEDMRLSKLVITSSGYNTCCELACIDAYRIVFPRKSKTGEDSEQFINANLFFKCGYIDEILCIADKSTENFAEKIRHYLTNGTKYSEKHLKDFAFDASEKIIKTIISKKIQSTHYTLEA